MTGTLLAIMVAILAVLWVALGYVVGMHSERKAVIGWLLSHGSGTIELARDFAHDIDDGRHRNAKCEWEQDDDKPAY